MLLAYYFGIVMSIDWACDEGYKFFLYIKYIENKKNKKKGEKHHEKNPQHSPNRSSCLLIGGM